MHSRPAPTLEALAELDTPLLVAVAQSSPLPRVTRRHSHARGQLMAATHGLITVEVREARWVVPATHAMWMPPHVPHGLRSHGPFAGWSAYVAEPACDNLPHEPRMLATSVLLREAIARATTWTPSHDALDEPRSRLAGVILDEIRATPPATLGLPMPRDKRLLRIARALSEHPDDERNLDAWAAFASVAPRTVTRRFVEETGFSFTQWRQRVRLLRALELLAAGRPVNAIALDLGYDNVSAFIALFKRSFGVTPGRYAASASK